MLIVWLFLNMNNMKKIDYKVGDVVIYNNTICKIEYKCGGFGVDLNTGNKDVFMIDLEPIPITDDILKKLGFEYSDFLKYWYYNTGLERVKITYDFNTKKFHCSTKDFTAVCKCEYIHEIGRALDFCDLRDLYFYDFFEYGKL